MHVLPRRNPDVVDSPVLELRDVLLESNPMLLVSRDVPLKSLHHGHVLLRRLLHVFAHLDGVYDMSKDGRLGNFLGKYGGCLQEDGVVGGSGYGLSSQDMGRNLNSNGL